MSACLLYHVRFSLDYHTTEFFMKHFNMQILIMGLQILTPSCAIVWISQYENCQFRFSKAGNPF